MKTFKQFTESDSYYEKLRQLTIKMLPLDREKEGRERILKMIDGWEKQLQEK